jgi:hypothetical protein
MLESSVVLFVFLTSLFLAAWLQCSTFDMLAEPRGRDAGPDACGRRGAHRALYGPGSKSVSGAAEVDGSAAPSHAKHQSGLWEWIIT